MNEEELEKEAEDYADKHAFRIPYDGSNKFYDDVDYKASVEAYLAGAEPREKRIAELEDRIEKVRHYLDYDMSPDFINGATIMICRMLKENKELHNRCKNCALEISKGKLEDLQNENVDLLGKIAFTENALNNEKAKVVELEKENAELEAQIEKMKCDVLALIKDRMNDDIDQNIIERLAENGR